MATLILLAIFGLLPPVTVVDHGIALRSPWVTALNVITGGSLRVKDALWWMGIPLTSGQATAAGLCHHISEVKDRTVTIKADPYQRGIASWYGPGFDGKSTANGEVYQMYAQTAAHRTLPLDSRVRVISKKTGTSTIARINDRGPYAKGRIIDLSFATKQSLGVGDLASVYLERIDEHALDVSCK